MNVVNKRAGEPQKLIVLLTIIIGNKKNQKKIKNFSKKVKRGVDTFSLRVYIHIHRRTALLGSGKKAV